MRYLNSPSVLNTIQKNIDYGTVSINKEKMDLIMTGEKKNHKDIICYNHRA